MKLSLIKTEHGLIPAFDDDVFALKKVPQREMISVEWKPGRSLGNHNRFFSFLNAVFPNQEYCKTVDHLRTEIMFKAGYFDIHVSSNGEKIYKIKSMSFDDMDEAEFQKLFSSAIDVALTLVGDEAVKDILRFI